MGSVANIIVPDPPRLTPVTQGATTQGQAYALTMPGLATDPLTVTNRDGQTFTWKPTELAYRDAAGQMDYIVGSAPASVSLRGREARYSRLFPSADDVFIARAEQIKHWTILHEAPRSPAVYLGSGVEFGVTGLVGGIPLPPGFHDEMEAFGFKFPRPVARDLTGNEVLGRYQVIDTNAGQQLMVWFPADWFATATYPVMIDPTIATSTSVDATVTMNQRKVDRFSNGVLFAMFYDGTNMVCRYSSDNGATWSTPGTGATIGAYTNGSCVVDADNYLHLAVKGTYVYYIRGTPDAGRTSYTWSAASTLEASSNTDWPDLCAHPEGTGWKAHCVWGLADATPANSARYAVVDITSDGVITVSAITQLGGSYGVNAQLFPSISIDASKNLYVAWTTGATGTGKGIRFKKAAYSAGSWTWGSEEPVDENAGYSSTTDHAPSGVIGSDGVFHALWGSSLDGLVRYAQRSSGGVWSAIENPFGTNVRYYPVITIDGSTPYAIVYASAPQDINYAKRSGGSWLAEALFADPLAYAQRISARRTSAGNALDIICTVGSASPYNVNSYRLGLNQAPNAPTLTAKPNFDKTDAQTFAWTFNDPDAGNTQSAYQLLIIRVSDAVTVLDTGKVVSATSSYALAANTLVNNVQYQWQVRTWDQSDAVGPYSSLSTFWCSAKPTATITVPATDGDTVATSSLTAQWTTSDPEGEGQSAYQVRLTDNADVQLWSSGKVTSSGLAQTIGYTLVNSTNYKTKVTVWDAKDVASAEVVRTFVTSFTAPATPTITATPNADQFPPYISVTVTNPTPGGSQPAVNDNTIQRSADGGATWTTMGTCSNNGTFTDYAPASGIAYQYRAVANGANGTTSTSTAKVGSITREHSWFVPKDTPSSAIPFAWNRESSWQHDREATEIKTRGPATVTFFGGSNLDRINISATFVDAADASPHAAVSLTKEQWRQRFKTLVGVQGYLCSADGLVERGILMPPSGTFNRDLVVNAWTVQVVFVEKGPIP